MGQYPSPYSPPQFPMGPGNQPLPPELLAPAKRASTLMFVIAVICLLLGFCMGVVLVAIPKDQFKSMMAAQHVDEKLAQVPPGMAMEDFLREKLVFGAAWSFLVGIVLILLGTFVRRANKIAIVISTIVCSLLSLQMCFELLFAMLTGGIGNALVGMIPLALFSVVTVWLIKAYKLQPQIEQARLKWQANYAASQQQQQAYGQGTYGYPPAQTPGYGQPAIGFGAAPPVAPGEQSGPAVRHPPLPPDQQNPPQ